MYSQFNNQISNINLEPMNLEMNRLGNSYGPKDNSTIKNAGFRFPDVSPDIGQK